jgi:amidohydrolase
MDTERFNPDSGLAAKLMSDLAEIAEPSFLEFKTTSYIVNYLKSIGITPENIYETGCWGTLNFGADTTIALRSDIDALPADSEKTEYRHLCGHNHNMTVLLMTLAEVMRNPVKPKVNIRYIFQPAEELVSGAEFMISKGCLADVSAIFAIHAWSDLPVGCAGIKSGPVMAGSHHFDITVSGKAAHAAMPHVGTDTVTAAAAYVTSAQMIVSRLKDPVKAGLISFGSFHGGSAANILPDEVKLQGTFRYFHEDVRAVIEKGMLSLAESIRLQFGTNVDVNIHDGTTPVSNDPALASFFVELADSSGLKRVPFEEPSLGGEDFAFYLKSVPGVFVRMGANEKDVHPPLHSKEFYVPAETVSSSVRLWVALVYGVDRFFQKG